MSLKTRWKAYLSSFQKPALLGKTFLIDAAVVGLLFALFSLFSGFLQKKAAFLQEAQGVLGSQDPQALLPYLTDIRSFLLLFIIGGVLFLVIALLTISFSRAYVWGTLEQKKVQKLPWRWVGFSVAVAIPSLFFGALLFLIDRFGFWLFRKLLSANASWYLANPQTVGMIESFFNAGLNFLLLVLLSIFLFSNALVFIHRERVWASIGEASHLLQKNLRQLPAFLLFSLGTALLISLFSRLFSSAQYLYPNAWAVLSAAVSLLYLSWLRIYFLESLHYEPTSKPTGGPHSIHPEQPAAP